MKMIIKVHAILEDQYAWEPGKGLKPWVRFYPDDRTIQSVLDDWGVEVCWSRRKELYIMGTACYDTSKTLREYECRGDVLLLVRIRKDWG